VLECEDLDMIGVIADDLTGAAELGGVGVRMGLSAEIIEGGTTRGKVDLVCVDTDSRLCGAEEARRRAGMAARQLVLAGASWVYKKVDSVLRGQVTAEIEGIMGELGLGLALLAPANPSLGRVISKGHYFVRGTPIHQTEFSRDPAYPRTSSSVVELLAAPKRGCCCCRHDESLPVEGVAVAEVETSADVQRWAARAGKNVLLAGGADFFAALLRERTKRTKPTVHSPEVRGPVFCNGGELFICGSISEATVGFIKRERERGTPVFSLPEAAASGKPLDSKATKKLVSEIVAAFKNNKRVVVDVGLPPVREASIAVQLSKELVRLAEGVLRKTSIGKVYAEGGATAVELVRRMGWERLRVMQELAQGVAVLDVGNATGTVLVIKPGSYCWPESVSADRTQGSSTARKSEEMVRETS
jgi:uncharacterized protein YgbK (DUF1537 family)